MTNWTEAELAANTEFPNFKLPESVMNGQEGRAWCRIEDGAWEVNVGGFSFLDGVDVEAVCRFLNKHDAEPVAVGAAR